MIIIPAALPPDTAQNYHPAASQDTVEGFPFSDALRDISANQTPNNIHADSQEPALRLKTKLAHFEQTVSAAEKSGQPKTSKKRETHTEKAPHIHHEQIAVVKQTTRTPTNNSGIDIVLAPQFAPQSNVVSSVHSSGNTPQSSALTAIPENLSASRHTNEATPPVLKLPENLPANQHIAETAQATQETIAPLKLPEELPANQHIVAKNAPTTLKPSATLLENHSATLTAPKIPVAFGATASEALSANKPFAQTLTEVAQSANTTKQGGSSATKSGSLNIAENINIQFPAGGSLTANETNMSGQSSGNSEQRKSETGRFISVHTSGASSVFTVQQSSEKTGGAQTVALQALPEMMMTRAAALKNGTETEMRVKISPPDLGLVHVTLRKDAQGTLIAAIAAPSAAAGVISAHTQAIRDAMAPYSAHTPQVHVSAQNTDGAGGNTSFGGNRSEKQFSQTNQNHAIPEFSGTQADSPLPRARNARIYAAIDYDA